MFHLSHLSLKSQCKIYVKIQVAQINSLDFLHIPSTTIVPTEDVVEALLDKVLMPADPIEASIHLDIGLVSLEYDVQIPGQSVPNDNRHH